MRVRWWVGGVVVAVRAVASGCSGTSEPQGSAPAASSTAPPASIPEPAQPIEGPSPFDLDPFPDDWRLVGVGEGKVSPVWGDDTSGTDEAFTVLRRTGSDAATGIRVSAFGFEGQQGGFEQSVPGAADPDEGRDVHFELDGQRAIYWPGDPEVDTWGSDPFLAVVVGEDSAISAHGPGATRDELEAVVAATASVGDRRSAPVVSPPDGFEVIGSVHADGAMAAAGHRSGLPFDAPGPEGALGVELRRGPARLTVVAMRGDALDLDALWQPSDSGHLGRPQERSLRSDGVPGDASAVTLQTTSSDGRYITRTIVRPVPWGDLLVARAEATSRTIEQDLPTFDELAEVAESVVASEAGWERLRLEAVGGPALPADEGRVEIARGEAGGIEWMLQTAELHEGGTDRDRRPDSCLKLSSADRVCSEAGVSVPGSDQFLLPSTGTFPPTVIAATTFAGAEVRLIDGDGAVAESATLAQVPGTARWAGVLVTDLNEPTRCGPDREPPPAGEPWMEVRGADGTSLGCLGRR